LPLEWVGSYDDTLKSPDDVRKATELTTLGAVPVMKGLDPNATLAAQAEGQSAAAEAYRVLRTNLQFVGVGKPLRTLMITSPEPSEGKSITAGNLAAALAQAGKQVVLVDADLHRPRQHRLFSLPNNVGLTTALLDGEVRLESLLQGTAVPGLSVLTTGPLPPNPAELLGSDRMHGLIAALAARCDTLIFDTPPALALADAAVLGSQVDGVLMVFNAGGTRREMAHRAVAALQQANARVVGALLNRVPAKSSGYYYYYYRYGYSYRTGSDATPPAGKGGRGLFKRPSTRALERANVGTSE
jgi:capsular exopolysaccharide synthesis family protein